MNTITINTSPTQEAAQKSAESPSNTAGNTVNKYIYGHFAEHLGRCIYEGIWVGTNSEISNIEGYRTDVIEALRELEIPVLRWPGGCFADEYHWKDGVGPYEERKRMVNTHWGGVVENNHFGTHEFLRFCELIHTEPYICGNVGSGTVQEMSEWVEYMTFAGESPMANWRRANGKESPWPLTYFGVGNENWGCGGNMTAEYYADLFRRYATYVRNYDGNQVQKIAGGPNVDDFHWTETCMKKIPKGMMWGLSLHNYTFTRGWDDKGNATGFTEEEWYQVLKDTLRMDLLIQKHSEIMDKYDPDKQVALVIDEWGTWFNVEPDTNPGFLYQQNTIRDALLAAVNFNIFHKYCDRVQMTNIAQMINVLQAVILTDNEKMIKTPTYHAFHMYKVHKEAEVLPLELVTHQVGVHATSAGISGASMGVAPTGSKSAAQDDIKVPALSATATRNSKGVIHISLCNLSTTEPQSVACAIAGLSAQTAVTGTILSANSMDSHNTFDNPTAVAPMDFHGFSIEDSKLHIELPPMSVVTLSVG